MDDSPSRPASPGNVLKNVFMNPLNINLQDLSLQTGIKFQNIQNILSDQEPITPDIAIRFSRFFNTTPEFWINLQVSLDLWNAFQTRPKEYENIRPVFNR